MRCYLLCVTSGSSVDRQSNNVSLFNLIEQINVPATAMPAPRGVIPVEIHAYFELDPPGAPRELELRFSLRAETGLETFSEVFRQRVSGARFRIRAMGLPAPPVVGGYSLHVDARWVELDEAWQRQAATWPIRLNVLEPRPQVTH